LILAKVINQMESGYSKRSSYKFVDDEVHAVERDKAAE
jgi:hypothetical protein